MYTNFKRIFNFAINDFLRNKGISVAAIFVLVITMMLVTGLLFFYATSSYLISQVQDKIDITAYFKDTATEQEILKVKDEITKISPDIKGVEYVSKEQAMQTFTEKHKDNNVFSKALEEVGDNPFLPSLNIKTNGEPAQYENVSNILQTAEFAKLIEKVDFSQKKDTIKKVYSITSNINRFGLILSGILVIVAILVVYNTIKLAVDSSKEEIGTMRIVGASKLFVDGPFMVQGALYGLVAFAICIMATAALVYVASPKVAVVLPGFSMMGYFMAKLWLFVIIQLGFGIGVGIVSSYIVVSKHIDE